MELVIGRLGELVPGPYVDCPDEGCAYTLQDGVLMRHVRNVELVLRETAKPIDPERDALEHERPRLRRIARMLVESTATARLASPYVVFVPRAGEAARELIPPGSGIVGAPAAGAERVVVYYQAAVRGGAQMRRFAGRAFHAQARLAERVSTHAQMALPRTALIEVGTVDPQSRTVAAIDAEAESALADWLGAPELDPEELAPREGVS
jgi:hypothetical protein